MVESYGYPQVYTVAGEDKTIVGYKRYYDSDDGVMYNFNGATYEDILIQDHPQLDPYTRPLIVHLQDLDNGLSVVMEYFTVKYPDRGIFHVDAHIKTIERATYDTIDDISLGDGNYYYSDKQVGFDMRVLGGGPSLEPIRYFPSYVDYAQYGTETTIGDPAVNMDVSGAFFWAESPSQHPISDLRGTMSLSEISNGDYHIAGINNFIYNDDQLDKFQEGIIDAGDGTNPFPGPITPSDNPFENDPSRTGGGKGKYEKNGDKTGKPALPTSAVLSSGFIAMYNPTDSQLQALGAKLWSDDFFDNFIKLWNDPMEAIISLGLIPFTPASSGSTNCQIGNYDTEVSMARVTSQYQTLSCGSVIVGEYWGSALDYGPYTEAEIFLPFVGMKKLDIDDIMGKTVSVDYNVDLLGGEAVCYITVDDVVLYDFRCNLQTSIPISSSSYASLYSTIIKGVSGMAIGAAAGGVAGAAAGGLTSAVNVISSKHGSIERGSELSPNAGVLGLLTPYIIIHRVVQSLPTNFGHFKGYPSNVTRTLGSCSGYTEVEYIHLDGINATEEEKQELLTILKEGIVI